LDVILCGWFLANAPLSSSTGLYLGTQATAMPYSNVFKLPFPLVRVVCNHAWKNQFNNQTERPK
jgi:hypothetical protein